MDISTFICWDWNGWIKVNNKASSLWACRLHIACIYLLLFLYMSILRHKAITEVFMHYFNDGTQLGASHLIPRGGGGGSGYFLEKKKNFELSILLDSNSLLDSFCCTQIRSRSIQTHTFSGGGLKAPPPQTPSCFKLVSLPTRFARYSRIISNSAYHLEVHKVRPMERLLPINIHTMKFWIWDCTFSSYPPPPPSHPAWTCHDSTQNTVLVIVYGILQNAHKKVLHSQQKKSTPPPSEKKTTLGSKPGPPLGIKWDAPYWQRVYKFVKWGLFIQIVRKCMEFSDNPFDHSTDNLYTTCTYWLIIMYVWDINGSSWLRLTQTMCTCVAL